MAAWQIVSGLLAIGLTVVGMRAWRFATAAVSADVVAKFEDL